MTCYDNTYDDMIVYISDPQNSTRTPALDKQLQQTGWI